MKRWGLVGLLAVTACAPEAPSNTRAQNKVCEGVIAGELPGELRQGLSMNGTPVEENDGREAVIIRYRSDVRAGASTVRASGARVNTVYRNIPAVAARISPAERAVLAASPLVESIEPDQTWFGQGLAPAPVLEAATSAAPQAIQATEYTAGLRAVQAPDVWDTDGDGRLDPGAPTGAGVRVCIIDSGLDPRHPELQGAVVASKDFIDGDDDPSDSADGVWGQGHGTHVAGIIAARPGQGGRGIPVLGAGEVMGVAPGAQLLIARVLDVYGRTQMSLVFEALEWCEQQGARVASLSLGGGMSTRTSRESFKAALDHGMLVVAASGNQGGAVLYPASDASVLAVGAVDTEERRAGFSNGGDELGLVAPGVDVLSTFPLGRGSFSEVDVGGTHPVSRSLLFAPPGEPGGQLVDCGDGDSLDSCMGGTCSGFVAYVRPGRVSIDEATANVMMQGARAVIFGTEEGRGGGSVDIISLPQRGHWVPAVSISQASSTVLQRLMGSDVRMKLYPVDYAYASGTSMATPYVSGAAAVLWSARPELTPLQVREALESSARDLGPSGKDPGYGHGLVQVKDALSRLP